jgi:hypothetical protein
MEIRLVVPRDLLERMSDDAVLTFRLEGGEARLKPAPSSEPAGPPHGPLAALIEQGLLTAGERLYWHRPRLGKRFVATVLASGELEVDGRRYRSPSDAATACAKNAVNGWSAWRKESDGTLLDELRR